MSCLTVNQLLCAADLQKALANGPDSCWDTKSPDDTDSFEWLTVGPSETWVPPSAVVTGPLIVFTVPDESARPSL